MRFILIAVLLGLPMLLHAAPAAPNPKADIQLTDSQFVDLYVKLSLLAEKFLSDSLVLRAKQDSLFTTYKINMDQFVKFKEKYDREPEKYKYIWQDVIKRLEAEEKKTKDAAVPSPPVKKDK